MKFKLVWVTINGYCLSWLLPVSDLDWGILGKKLHGIKWIFLNYKACNSSGSKYQLSVSSQPARKKMVGSDNKKWSATFILQSQMFLVLIILEKEAADSDQLSLVSKLNGCRLQWCKTWVLAPDFKFKCLQDKFFESILLWKFLWASHNSQVIIRDDSWPMGRMAWKCSSNRFPSGPIITLFSISLRSSFLVQYIESEILQK